MGKRRTLKYSMVGMIVLASTFSASLTIALENVLFGYSMDGWPVSAPHMVQGKSAGVQGFCGNLWQYLQQEGYQGQLQELWFDTRFVTFAKELNGRSGVECGPSSVTPERIAALQPVDSGFNGVFSHPFAVTSSKLLIRNTRLEAFYTDLAQIRIGVLEAGGDVLPVTTTALVAKAFPSAQIKPLGSRQEAVTRLLQAVSDENAIDAYASDEILLHGILDNPAEIPPERRDQYTIEPPLGGFSREEYGIVVYNNPALLDKVNAWLVSPAGRDAAADLQPQTDTFTRTLAWLNRSDHLVKARLVLVGIALCGALAVMLLMRRSRRRARLPSQPLTGLPAVMTQERPASEALLSDTTVTPSVPAETCILTPQQLRVARLWANGHQAGVIAKMLDIGSSRTVEAHIRAVYQKTSTNNRIALLKYLQEQQLL